MSAGVGSDDGERRFPTPQPAQRSSPQSQRSSTFSSAISIGSYQSSKSVGTAVEASPFRRSLAPTPKPNTGTERLHGTYSEHRPVTPLPQFTRSAAPSLSDYVETLRSQSHDIQTLIHHSDDDTTGETSREVTTRTADLAKEIDRQIPDKHASFEVDNSFPTGVRSPTWSLLTASPVARLPTVAEINDEDVCPTPGPSPSGNSNTAHTFQRSLKFRAEIQEDNHNENVPRIPNLRKTRATNPRPRGGRIGSRRPRRARASTRWSSISPWTSAEKAAFHNELQQRIAAVTCGTDTDSGLLDVPVDYFDI
ncbi:hypothetical protein BDP55DRAFT_743140 [Colletotrichum godetiae]|uniref:Uncharacterized protein n=1 Tax=Colletotrichum godetiae TaxID=1209918 RepID=A0AAJ0EZL1_9PEZI|nr:uncharacterized protein BDP55DRAFT_743140 [Colletotrichum godetiae]KAK1700213.1 hypothetical protein BDP55DRAFT_743140 [Colletotrichum godetiae]